jgi:hypothetical protein
VVLAALAACAASLAPAAVGAAPAAADTLTFGSTLRAPTPGTYDACSVACTSAQLGLPGTQLVSPVSGTLTAFRLRTGAGSDPQTIHFRVLRSSDGSRYTGVGTSAAMALSTSAGVTEYPVSMPVRAGDVIGFDQAGANVHANVVRVNSGAFQAAWFPNLGDGAMPKPSDNPQGSPPTRYELLLQAEVEYDPSTEIGCTDPETLVADCADANGVPSVCGPHTNFPQCGLPVTLPSACSGTGTGLPVCNLPGNHIVACGGFGLNLPICDLPPLEVPQVCGPTTVGLRPCAPANVQVLACGPTDLGFPPCAFNTLIKAPPPIVVEDGELSHESRHLTLSTTLGCPGEEAVSLGKRGEGGETCPVAIDLIDLAQAKVGALALEAKAMSRLFEQSSPGFAPLARTNAASFRQRTSDETDLYILRPLDGHEPYRPMSSSDRSETIRRLSRKDGQPRYMGPPEVYDNYLTRNAVSAWTDSLGAAVSELAKVQRQTQSSGKARAARGSGLLSAGRHATHRGKPLVERRLRLSATEDTEVKLRLKKKVLNKLIKQAPRRRGAAVPVRLIVSFDTEPRPIARFVDFALRIKRTR